jgi:radical SAM-linked protein
VKYITHLDLMRFWERALRRADVALAYSEGHTPHARLSLAAPLAVGVTSSAELMDVFLTRRTAPPDFTRSVSAQLPAGIEVLEVAEVGLGLPSLQSEMRWARYRVEGPFEGAPEEVRAAVDRFLAAESIPWQHMREKQVRKYDIRALVRDLRVDDAPQGGYALAMVLRCDNTATGRPEQVAAALGLPEPSVIHRQELVLAGTSLARQAWRRRGRFEQ